MVGHLPILVEQNLRRFYHDFKVVIFPMWCFSLLKQANKDNALLSMVVLRLANIQIFEAMQRKLTNMTFLAHVDKYNEDE